MDHSPNAKTLLQKIPANRTHIMIIFIIICLLTVVIIYLKTPKALDYQQQTLSLPNFKPVLKEETIKNTQEWQSITVKPGDSLSSIFQRAGLTAKTLQLVLQNNPHKLILSKIKPNQTFQFLIKDQTLETLTVPHSKTDTLIIQRDAHGYSSQLKSIKTSTQNQLVTATVQGSLYGTAKRMNIPFDLIKQMTTIFSQQINFAREIRSGDQFTILYKANYHANELVSTGEILAVSYTNRGKTYQAIRHEISHQEVDYFTPEGNSLRQAFSRYPVQFSHISSMFSLSRMHPILHYRRKHVGVDLVAPLGTPVHATGDGRIETIERHSTYGNVIKIYHPNAYTSVYAHLHHFQRGLTRGSRVKRGQVIGYVGKTGLAEGPHCHYEFHVNGLPINPSTVILPRAASIPKPQINSFKKRALSILSQLKFYETAHLASTKKRIT
jgi:murein DD-endopeptidase MepM/ murein hydrolase activator NlpD